MAFDHLTLPSVESDLSEPQGASPMGHLLDAVQLHGYRPLEDEPDPRPLPDPHAAERLLYDAFDAIGAMLAGTRLEDDLPALLWSVVNAFHRRLDAIGRALDDNEQAQRRSQAEQDGSEVKSVELERLLRQGLALIDRRDSFEAFRDHAAQLYETHTGSVWRPRSGSVVNHRTLTAALIDSREFIMAKRRVEAAVLIPAGTRVAVTGGSECNDVARIWAALDRVRAKYADMVILHGGSPRGAELIAAKWADTRKVPQVVFKPDWAKHKNAAPFKRNDRMLEAMPAGVIVFPGNGVSANLADKARKLGIPVMRFDREASGA